ncbi:TROVE domain-containing protein [Streptomyces sp. NPDC000594]|uniref:TROVE domain-containing protein n=1 Tax=Streptomyces sp. NPDC000594 TaxID=3154261 RepID=UPI00332CCCFE
MAHSNGPDDGPQRVPGSGPDPRTALFRLIVGHFVNPEALTAAGTGTPLIVGLRELSVADPEWTAGLIGWLRSQDRMRTVSLMAAAEYVRARIDAARDQGPSNRAVVGSVLRRADDPAALIAYWMERYGRSIPKPVKRGVADAVARLWNGRALLEYDHATSGYRFGDILSLVHAVPDPAKPWQPALFRYAVDRRHRPDTAEPPPADRALTAHRALLDLPVAERRAAVLAPGGAARLAADGIGAEEVTRLLQGTVDASVWEVLIPLMEPLALVEQLGTFDRVGIAEEAAGRIAERIADPAEVARAGALPLRYLAAHQQTSSLRWSEALERALGHALALVPRLPGRTLVLVDRSASMWSLLGEGRRLTKADAASVFGIAVAMRAERADLVQFGSSSAVVRFRPGDSVLAVLERFVSMGGTHAAEALRERYRGHDRVLVVTDEPAGREPCDTWWPGVPGPDTADPGGSGPSGRRAAPVYSWHLARRPPGARSPGPHCFEGLTDDAFRMVPLLERAERGEWPWN